MARKAMRPMRPKPLMATRMGMMLSPVDCEFLGKPPPLRPRWRALGTAEMGFWRG
jgi:hypothetical protein